MSIAATPKCEWGGPRGLYPARLQRRPIALVREHVDVAGTRTGLHIASPVPRRNTPLPQPVGTQQPWTYDWSDHSEDRQSHRVRPWDRLATQASHFQRTMWEFLQQKPTTGG
jgi:hypothetical protein